VLAASVGFALAVALADVPVIAMLEAASIVGGIAAPIALVLLVRLATDPQVMGARPISRWLAAAGWAVAVVLGGLSLLFAVHAILS
jgi:Mn2+/Fe2+ NRAMP family transporter